METEETKITEPKQEVAEVDEEIAENQEESIEEAEEEKITIAPEDIVYEENDIVFVIAKSCNEFGPNEYGYFITASGGVFPFQEVYGGMERTDYTNASQMQEPILIFENGEINYYIDQLKNIRLEHQIKGARYAFGLMFENILLYGRRIDEDGKVEIEKIYYNTSHSEGWAYEPEGEEIMNWLLELNDRLTAEQERENR